VVLLEIARNVTEEARTIAGAAGASTDCAAEASAIQSTARRLGERCDTAVKSLAQAAG
jgi:ubiquinone biosynthesis protein UbiJ